MPEYSVVFARSARKELESLETEAVERIFPRILDPPVARRFGVRKACGECALANTA